MARNISALVGAVAAALASTITPAEASEPMAPDASGYQWAEAPYDFVTLSGGVGAPTGLLSGSVSVALPWALPFYGGSWTDAWLHENGTVTLCTGPTSTSADTAAAPGAGTTQRWIVILSWEAVSFSSENDGSFQVHLWPDGRIEYHYADVGFTTTLPQWNDGATATVGVQDRAGETAPSGNAVQYSCEQAALYDGLALVFIPPGATLDVCSVGCTFADLPSALAAAVPGDIVELSPGIWPGCFEVPGG